MAIHLFDRCTAMAQTEIGKQPASQIITLFLMNLYWGSSLWMLEEL